MTDQVQIQSVTKLDSDFVTTQKFLGDMASSLSSVMQGKTPSAVTKLPADITKPSQLRDAFPLKGLDAQMTDVVGDETKVGTVGDLQIIARQSDAMAVCIRACSSCYTSRAQRKLQAAFRLSRHAGPDGLWTQLSNRLQSTLQNTKK